MRKSAYCCKVENSLFVKIKKQAKIGTAEKKKDYILRKSDFPISKVALKGIRFYAHFSK